MTPALRNLITDVPGLLVGNAEDPSSLSGTTVIRATGPLMASADIRGGAPGTRETDALAPENMVETIHALVFSGGSVFGLDAASEVTLEMARQGTGFRFGHQPWPCPVVPAAILFDLVNGGDKTWGAEPPYRRLGREALAAAAADFALGNAGAGFGAAAGVMKGGLGSASAMVGAFTVGALVAVNSVGSCADPATGRLWALPHAVGDEMGPADLPVVPGLGGTKLEVIAARQPGANTTLAAVATDARLTKAECRRLALMAQDGLAIAIRPMHTPFDGDSVFALSTGQQELGSDRATMLAALGSAAAITLARAVGRAVWLARDTARHKSYRSLIGA